MGTTAVGLVGTPLIPVSNTSQPCEGPLALSLFLDFTASQSYTVDARPFSDRGNVTTPQTLYADTTGCTANLTILVDRTQQLISLKPNTQGFYPLLAPTPFRLTFSCTAGPVVHVMVLNVAIQPGQWPTVPITVASFQSPWVTNVNAANYSLTNVSQLGVGTGYTPTAELQVFGPGQNVLGISTSSGLGGTIILQDSGGSGNNGGAVIFGANPGQFAAIKGFLSNGASNTQGHLSFQTRLNATDATLTQAMIIQANGQVGIGITNSSYLLQLGADSAAKPTTTTWTVPSGSIVKKDVKDLEGGLEIINQLRPVEAKYNGRAGTPDNQRIVSCIAEEIEKVLPGCVTHTEVDGEDVLGFNPHEVIFHLILAVQQLSKEVTQREHNRGRIGKHSPRSDF